MEGDPPDLSAETGAFASAVALLRATEEAIGRLDLARAGECLRRYDTLLRSALSQTPPALSRSEAELLHHAQTTLLGRLMDVQRRVELESSAARKSGQAARAYLGNADG